MKFYNGGGKNLTAAKPKLYSANIHDMLRERLSLIAFLVDYKSERVTERVEFSGRGQKRKATTTHYHHAHDSKVCLFVCLFVVHVCVCVFFVCLFFSFFFPCVCFSGLSVNASVVQATISDFFFL